MMQLSAGLLVLLGLAGSLCAQTPPPTVVINLSLSPEKRWEPLQKAFDINRLKKAAGALIASQIPKWLRQAVNPIAMTLEKYVPQPYAGEIRGIAGFMKTNPADVMILNFAYEFTAYCTSIVAQDQKGNIYHGRNFDYPHLVLNNLTMNVVFYKNGKVVYFGTSFAGYVGLWTGMSPYKFTVSGNQRETELWWNWRKNVVSALLYQSHPVSWLVRETLEEAKDFQDAVKRLSETPLITGVYYIVGGVRAGEGVIITRDRKGPADTWPLEPLKGGWYRVETNHDHWLSPPPSDQRRGAAFKALNAVGQNRINSDKLYQVLSVPPVCNRNTIYTTLMSAATPWEYTTVMRQKGCPKKIN
ncbi:N-acylethanolamine-hydrolyzing acid amidase-like [Girardinichthys multiradiatus]|uniref:N-acylethanolamine-hydrolyzing acid amidase-like n=1 Tax=Girardinichthys multiradiatus TaxID=208333 RepID=UPI001FABB806|nr:N-acylethanolamine-hydrolyzing acid amidase-like [Girardinichthys multiradiatus]